MSPVQRQQQPICPSTLVCPAQVSFSVLLLLKREFDLVFKKQHLLNRQRRNKQNTNIFLFFSFCLAACVTEAVFTLQLLFKFWPPKQYIACFLKLCSPSFSLSFFKVFSSEKRAMWNNIKHKMSCSWHKYWYMYVAGTLDPCASFSDAKG